MCGIFCEVRIRGQTLITDEQILKHLKNRGPDCDHSIKISINADISVYFCATVLWMQGPYPTTQPIENDHGILLFNGDIFNPSWREEDLSDTNILSDKFSNCSSPQDMLSVIRSLKGPFSFIYYDKQTQRLYFGRDRIGRNSLLFSLSDSYYAISSVFGMKHPCVEIPANYIYELEIIEGRLKLHSWDVNTDNSDTHLIDDWLKLVRKQQSLPDDKIIPDFDITLDLNDGNEIIKKIEDVSGDETSKLTILQNLLYNSTILKTVTDVASLLENSVKVRVETQPSKCKICIKTNEYCTHCSTGILFSGGLDCTILALLADKYVPKDQPIDLINVAFKVHNNDNYDVPDRITGRQSYEELKSVCSSRNWVFREINVSKDTVEQYQLPVIADLVYPRRTVLDESLGTALWFAAQENEALMTSPCRVLLVGSGADELFGGYMRHRQAFKRHGWEGLQKELMIDWKRISYRNLARDNRVICDHGRQPRMPYLDEDLVDYVLKLNPWLKCFPSAKLECGIGDKLMLRLVALYLGLSRVVTLPKRALQFGSRIANRKENGSDLSKNFV